MINFKPFLFLSLCLFFTLPPMAASSPMVERHLFSPEPVVTGSHKSPLALKLEKELMFTGVIISSNGRWAMIREKGKKLDDEVSGRLKEGDEIKGMVIRRIGNNFLILAGEGKEVRLNLYYEGKPRPAMPPRSETPLPSEGKMPSGTSPASSESGAGSLADERKSSVPRGSKTSARRPGRRTGASPPAENPFLDALGRTQTEDSQFPPDDTPSPQETPPNPFSE